MSKQKQTINNVIYISRYALAFSFLAFTGCVLISYPFADSFSIPVQVGAHILTIVFAGSFKVAVVALMAATKELNSQNVFLGDKDTYVAT
jgi:hypothetical protein